MKSVTLYLTALAICLFAVPEARSEVWFNSPDLRSAAADLRDFLNRKGEEQPPEKIAPPDIKYRPGDWVVADASKDRGGVIDAVLTPDERAFLERGNPENLVSRNLDGTYYLVGGGQRGAIYASVRLQALWEETGENPLAAEGENLHETPSFTIRIAGAGGPDGESDIAQPFPDDYDWEDYARDLAHFGINLTPGVLGGEIVPDEPLLAWGIHKILFVSANPFSESQLRTWRSSNRGDLKPTSNSRSTSDDLNWAPCLSTDFGKRAYTDWLNDLVEEHRTSTALVFYFSDWGAAPGEECQPGASLADRVGAFLKGIDSIAQSAAPDLKVYASTRGFSAEDLKMVLSKCPPRVGVYFEEPSTSLLDDPATGYDPSIAASEMDPVFEEVYINTLKTEPKETIAAVAAGDTGWLVSPTIGLPLPRTTYRKLQSAAELGAQNVAFAMGGFHPWVYSPATEVAREVFWNRKESYEDIVARIAARDFGHLAENIQSAWSQFERSIESMPSISRTQRLHRFVASNEDPLTEKTGIVGLEESSWPTAAREAAPYLLEALPAVVDSWETGVEEVQAAQVLVGENSYETAKRLRDSLFWSTFYLRSLESQNNVIRTLNLLTWVPDGEDPTKDPWRQAFLPIYRDESVNARGWADLLFAAPYSRIRVRKEVTTPAAYLRKMEQKETALEGLIGDR